MRVQVYEDAAMAAAGCAARLAGALRAGLAERGVASMAVSGGSTPRYMFRALSGLGLDWARIHLFWVDERGVEPDDEQSNYRMTREELIEAVALPKQNVHRMRGEWDAAEAAAFYADELRTFFAGGAGTFDAVQCGVGDDGHTASLFPGESLIEDRRGTVAGVWVEKKKQWRITLLPGAILGGRELLVLASGADKAEAVRAALQGPEDLLRVPAQLLRGGQWFLDQAAAARL